MSTFAILRAIVQTLLRIRKLLLAEWLLVLPVGVLLVTLCVVPTPQVNLGDWKTVAVLAGLMGLS